jgi:competence protein ComEC
MDAPKAGIRLCYADSTRSLPFPDGATLEVLHAPDADGQNSLADDRVALYRLHWHGWKILFTSDAGMDTERKALSNGKDLSSDVIIAGCHRTDISLGDAFLDAVHPKVIIASNNLFPLAERRDPNTLAYWKSRGIRVVDQAESGGVTLRVDDSGDLRIEGFLSASPVILKAR